MLSTKAGRSRRGVSQILFGLLLGQGAVWLSTPLLTRLYGPESLGAAAFLVSLASIALPVLTLRIELLIPRVLDDQELRWLIRNGLFCCLCGSALISIIFMAIFVDVATSAVFFVICFGLGANALMQQQAVREERYGRIALGRAVLGTSQVLTQIMLSLGGFARLGMQLGFAVSYAASALTLSSRGKGRECGTRDLGSKSSRRWGNLLRQQVRLVAAGLLNSAVFWLNVPLLRAVFDPEQVGNYVAAQRLIIAPSVLVTATLLPVVTGSLASSIREGSGEGLGLLKRWLIVLVPLGLAVSIVIVAIPGDILGSVLGSQFSNSAAYMRALVPLIGLQIVAGPFSQSLIILGLDKLQVRWDIFRFCLVVPAGASVAIATQDPVLTVFITSCTLGAAYVIFMVLLVAALKKA